MSTEFKYKLLVAFSAVCLLGLLAQTYYLWQMNQKPSNLETDPSSIPTSIEERLQASLDNGNSSDNLLDSNSWFGQSLTSDPITRMQQMQQRMDSIFNSFGGSGIASFGSNTITSKSPSIGLNETDTEFQVKIEIPPEHELEINTELENDRLTVSGSVKSEVSSSNSGFASNITSQSQFTRTFDLPEPVKEFGIFTEQTESGVIIKVPKEN